MESALQLLLVELLKYIVPILITPLVAYIILLSHKGLVYLQERIGQERFQEAKRLVDYAVKAAEQSGLKGLIEANGEAKKKWAVAELQRLLNERGLTNISVETLSTLIEASIRDGIQQGSSFEIVEGTTLLTAPQ